MGLSLLDIGYEATGACLVLATARAGRNPESLERGGSGWDLGLARRGPLTNHIQARMRCQPIASYREA